MDETDAPQTPGGAAVHPGGHGRRRDPGPDHRARSSPAGSTRAWTTSATSTRSPREFDEDLARDRASRSSEFGLPANLKLSVHSGSDKFSIYPADHGGRARARRGLHLKTAGTTWLEEVAGLALAGGDGAGDREGHLREAPRHGSTSCARPTRR